MINILIPFSHYLHIRTRVELKKKNWQSQKTIYKTGTILINFKKKIKKTRDYIV